MDIVALPCATVDHREVASCGLSKVLVIDVSTAVFELEYRQRGGPSGALQDVLEVRLSDVDDLECHCFAHPFELYQDGTALAMLELV